MSQSGSFITGNPGIGFVQTVTGNDGLVVVPAAGNINVLGDSQSILTTRTGANTLTVSLLNTTLVIGQTVGAVTDDIFTFNLNTPLVAISIVAEVMAAEDDYTQAGSYFITGGARRAAAGGAVLPTGGLGAINNATDFAAARVDIVVSGNDAIVRVTGEALTTINWQARIRYQTIIL